jgi:DNA-binding response OmpR family regulator
MDRDKPIILCVDDDPDIITYLRTVLEAEGFEVVSAHTAEDGLRQYRLHDPDALIVDMMMEEVDAGTRFVKELRADGNVAPILMLSSIGDSLSHTVETEQLGLAGVFQKPLNKETLLSVLRVKLAHA